LSRGPEFEGVVIDILGNNFFRVEVLVAGAPRQITCYLAGKMRQNKISILAGDRVRLEIPAQSDKGRIVYREK